MTQEWSKHNIGRGEIGRRPKKQKTKMTCTQLILPSHVEDNINFVSMRNKGNHHGRKADILWTLSVREGGKGSGVGPTTSLLESICLRDHQSLREI